MADNNQSNPVIRVTAYAHKLVKVYAAAHGIDQPQAAEQLIAEGYRALEKKRRSQDDMPRVLKEDN